MATEINEALAKDSQRYIRGQQTDYYIRTYTVYTDYIAYELGEQNALAE